MVRGFPIKLGNRIEPTPALHDIDLDGYLELMIGGSDLAFHVFDLDGNFCQWPRFHYDPYNSGCFASGFYQLRESENITSPPQPRFAVFPSPFSDKCVIHWSGNDHEIREGVSIAVYDLAGRLVFTKKGIVIDHLRPVVWGGQDTRGRTVPSGVYFVQIQHQEYSSIHKVIKVK
jgi:hypothetical protein